MRQERLTFPFNAAKAIEAAAAFLKRESERMSYMKLIKLLYLADRACFIETYATITGDQPFSMRHGPVLSETYNCIKVANPNLPHHQAVQILRAGQQEAYDCWSQYLEVRPDLTCKLINDPGNMRLSPFEMSVIGEISDQFHGKDQYDVRDWLHENHNCPEWHRIEDGSELITFESWMEHHMGVISQQEQAAIAEISNNLMNPVSIMDLTDDDLIALLQESTNEE